MRKAFKVSQTNSTSAFVVRVKLTTYKPTRPVTLERFRGIPAIALVREYEDQYNRAYTV